MKTIAMTDVARMKPAIAAQPFQLTGVAPYPCAFGLNQYSIVSAHAAFETDAYQFLRFRQELHRQLLEYITHEAVDDEGDGLLLG